MTNESKITYCGTSLGQRELGHGLGKEKIRKQNNLKIRNEKTLLILVKTNLEEEM